MLTKEGALYDLLTKSFTVDELSRFVLFGPEGHRLSRELPDRSVSLARFVSELIDVHRRRGLIDADFFARLKDLQPNLVEEIESVGELWLSEPGSTIPLTHPSPLADENTRSSSAKERLPTRVFVSYSHRDSSFVDELRSHLALLQRQGLLDVWHDNEITAGEEWYAVIDQQLEAADIILLLVSASFLASDFCWSVELQRAMERHEAKEAVVIPVILRPCLWTEAPFAKLQVLPRDGKPISKFRDTDAAWLDVASGIQRAVKRISRKGE